MSKLEIMLNKGTFKPGEKVGGSLFLNLDKDAKARDIVIEIYGNEHTEITRTRYNALTKENETVVYTENAEVINQSTSLIEKAASQYPIPEKKKTTTLMRNIYTLPFSFTLPEDATPSYKGSHAEVNYELTAKVDRPWRTDMKDEKKITVIPRDLPEKEGTSAMIQEKSGSKILPQALSPDIEMKVQLNKTELKRGEYLEGKIIATNNSGKEIRNIILELYANERAEAEGHVDNTKVMGHELKLPVNQPGLNYFEQKFTFQVPMDIIPGIHKKYFGINWYFKIGLDVAKAKDMETETEITIR